MRTRKFSRFWAIAVAAICLNWAGLQSANAEILDDEETAVIFATYIANDAGGTVAQYLPYARKLVKVVSKLSMEQQQRVFEPAVYAVLKNSGSGKGD